MAANASSETIGKEKSTRGSFSPFFDFGAYDFKGFEAASQTWKDLVAQQIRASYAIAEQGAALSRKATEYWTVQAQEAFKYQQEAAKFVWGVADDVRKAAYETAERSVK